MRKLIVLMLLLVCGVVTAQPETPTPTLFISESRDVAFEHPSEWTIEEDGPTVFFLQSDNDNFSVLIQITPAESAETLLDTFEGYSAPETLDNEVLRISDVVESVYAFPADEENIVLLFAIGTRAIRADYQVATLEIINSFTYGQEAVQAEPDEVTITEADFNGFIEDEFQFFDGIVSLQYPEAWLPSALEDLGLLFTDEDESFSVIISNLDFVFDSLGAEGDINTLITPYQVLNAILGNQGDEIIESYAINGRPAARFSVSDENGDGVLITFELVPDFIAVAIVDTEQGESIYLESTLNALIASMEYTQESSEE